MFKSIFILASLLVVQGVVVENQKPQLRGGNGDDSSASSTLQQRNLNPECPETFNAASVATCTTLGQECGYEYVWKPSIKGNEKCGGSKSDATCSPNLTCTCNGVTFDCPTDIPILCSNWVNGAGPAWAFKSCTPTP